MAIALMAAILVGTGPAQSAVRPTADFQPGTPSVLTPVPLGNWLTQLSIAEPADAIPLHPASDQSGDGGAIEEPDRFAAAQDEGHLMSTFLFSGIGVVLTLFVVLLVTGRKSRQDRMA